MIKQYIYIGVFLGLLAGYVGVYVAGLDAGRNEIRADLAEVMRERDALRQQAENIIIEEKVIWRDRIRTIEKTVVECDLPDDIVGVLRDAGIFTASSM